MPGDSQTRGPGRNRRRYPRLEVLGLVDGHLMPLGVPLTMVDLSQGGFSARSHTAFPPGAHHHFRFTTPRRDAITIEATAVHCRLAQPDADGHVGYVTGFEFVSNTRTDEAVTVLLDAVSSMFTLD